MPYHIVDLKKDPSLEGYPCVAFTFWSLGGVCHGDVRACGLSEVVFVHGAFKLCRRSAAFVKVEHSNLSSSFLGLLYRILNAIHKKELLRGDPLTLNSERPPSSTHIRTLKGALEGILSCWSMILLMI